MSNKGFRKPRKRNHDAADQFAEGADVSTNTENTKAREAPKKSKTQEPFYTTLQPRYKEIIQALSWYNRNSQREVVEQALEAYCSDKPDELETALHKYREQEE